VSMLAPPAALAVLLTWITGSPSVTTRPTTTRPALSDRQIDRLLVRLGDADAQVRLRAVEALARCDVPRVRRALMTARRDADRRVTLAAYRALVSLRAPELRPVILDALYEGDESVRLMAIPWVGEVRPRRASPALAGLLMDRRSSEAIRLAAARALGPLREETGIPALAAVLNATDWPPAVTDRVRIAAARSLGDLGGRFAIDELLKATRHPSARVRPAAVVALAPYAAAPRPTQAILKAARSADADTRRRFVHAHWESSRAAPAVCNIFCADADWSVRVEAVAGLAALKAPDGVSRLIDALAAGDKPARAAAHGYLRRFTGQSLPPDAVRWRAWWTAARPTFRFPPVRRPASKP